MQELTITSKDLIKERANLYAHPQAGIIDTVHGRGIEHPISELPHMCNFAQLDNHSIDKVKGEQGVYCSRLEYNYELRADSHQTLVEQKFTVRGAEDEHVTYLFDMNIDYEFFASARLTALVRRIDGVAAAGDYTYDPLKCLLDHHCAEAELIGKNQLSLDVILTTGEYELIIFTN